MKGLTVRLVYISVVFYFSSFVEAADSVTISTFNYDFLSKKYVHVKFDLPFDPGNWSVDQIAECEVVGFRDAQYRKSVRAVATTIKRIDANIIILTEIARLPKIGGEFVTPNDMTVLHKELTAVYPLTTTFRSRDDPAHDSRS